MEPSAAFRATFEWEYEVKGKLFFPLYLKAKLSSPIYHIYLYVKSKALTHCQIVKLILRIQNVTQTSGFATSSLYWQMGFLGYRTRLLSTCQL